MANRRIQRLNLSARTDGLIRRGVFLVEDAMRTASAPDTGRLLIYRSISLGTIRSDLPPSSLSLQLERRFRELASQAVHALEPTAKDAPCVFFWDDAEPYSALTLTLCKGGKSDAWFWPLAVPGFRTDMPVPEALRAAAQGAMSSAAGAGAFIRVFRELSQMGGLDMLLSVLSPEDGTVLVRTLWNELNQGPEPTHPSVPGPALDSAVPLPPVSSDLSLQSPMHLNTLRKWLEMWGIQDRRTRFLAAALLCVERPVRLFDRRLAGQVLALLRTLDAARLGDAPNSREPLTPSHLSPEFVSSNDLSRPVPQPQVPMADIKPPPHLPSLTRAPLLHTPPLHHKVETPVLPDRPILELTDTLPSHMDRASTPRLRLQDQPLTPSEKPFPQSPPEIHAVAQPESIPNSPLHKDGLHSKKSQIAGLFFLIPILERLGISTLLQSQPSLLDAEFAAHLLTHIALRLGADAEDPILQIFQRKIQQPGSIQDLIRSFHIAIRRYCRRTVGMGLVRLICREGWIQTSPTHCDIFFEHGQADILIRKAGLDIDPGWVPWLGWVISYHYGSTTER